MDWIREGQWKHVGGFASITPAVVAGSGTHGSKMEQALEEAKARIASLQFADDPDMWCEVIGARHQLVRYELDPDVARRAIGKAREVAVAVPKPLGDGSDGCTAEEASILIQFLREFGPLGPVVGLVEPVGARRHESEVGAVNLVTLRDQLHEIAAAETALRAANKPKVSAIADIATSYLELKVWPQSASVEISYRVEPVTLRASVWTELIRFGRVALGPRCNICGRKLPRHSGPGRQLEYCPKHDSERWRVHYNRQVRVRGDGL